MTDTQPLEVTTDNESVTTIEVPLPLNLPTSFSDYQKRAGATAVYPGQGTWVGVVYTGLGLGEAGELQGKIKKLMRDDNFELTADRREAMIGELGDVLWYAAMLATEIGVDLGTVADANLAKLASRAERGVIQGSGDNR